MNKYTFINIMLIPFIISLIMSIFIKYNELALVNISFLISSFSLMYLMPLTKTNYLKNRLFGELKRQLSNNLNRINLHILMRIFLSLFIYISLSVFNLFVNTSLFNTFNLYTFFIFLAFFVNVSNVLYAYINFKSINNYNRDLISNKFIVVSSENLNNYE